MSKLAISNRISKVDNLKELNDMDLENEMKWEELADTVFEITDTQNEAKKEISLSFCGKAEMQELNKKYLGKDYVTDVLSFEANAEGFDNLDQLESLPLGDIVICVPKAVSQAEEYGHSLKRELAFLFVHGLLHLLGYDHETEIDSKEMFALQEAILEKQGLIRL